MNTYKTVINNPFLNCNHIYPIQQRKVQILVDYLKTNDNIKSIIVFGSSVSDKCTIKSDLDVYVELVNQEKIIHRSFPFVFDLWTNYSVDKSLKNEILNKGVLVYERI